MKHVRFCIRQITFDSCNGPIAGMPMKAAKTEISNCIVCDAQWRQIKYGHREKICRKVISDDIQEKINNMLQY